MKLTADTTLLLRAILADDAVQAAQAQALLDQAELIAIPAAVLCELVWTLRRSYKRGDAEVAAVIESLLQIGTVVTDRAAAEAGLKLLRAGGNFADGLIAWQGMAMGAECMASFDRSAVGLLAAQGLPALIPG